MKKFRFAALVGIVLAGAIGLSACSGTGAKPAPTSGPPSGELHIGAFGGSLGQSVLSVLPQFEAAYPDIKVTSEDIDAAQEVTRLIQTRNQGTGNFDLVMMAPTPHLQGVRAGIWQELSAKDVPMMAKLPANVVPDGKYTAFGSFRAGYEVNTAALAAAGVPVPDSWEDLWNPIYKGHIVMGAMPSDGNVQAMFDMLWTQEGSKKAAEAKFEKLIPNVKAFVTTSPELDAAITSGDAWIAVNNESRALLTAEQGAPVKFVVPKPGAIVDWLLGIDVPTNAPNKKAAYAFINFLLQPAQQSKISDAGYFGPVNPDTVLTDRVKTLAETPKGAEKGHVTDWGRILDNLDDLTTWWNNTVSAG